MTSSKVALASSIIAHSSPFISTPCLAKSFGSTSRGSLPSSSSPSELARRLAGSMVTTATLAPSAAMPMAIAADVVVLPTPPEPPQMQMRLPSRSSGTFTARAQSKLGELVEAGPVELGLEDERQLGDRLVELLPETGDLLALGAGPAVLGERRAQRGARRRGARVV